MKLTINQLYKIDVYLGLSKRVVDSLRYWVSINPSEPLYVDEFIEWMYQDEVTI